MSNIHHPYERYEGSPIWLSLEKAIADLVENQDIEETTRREYIVGYLIQKVEGLEGMPNKAFQRTAKRRR